MAIEASAAESLPVVETRPALAGVGADGVGAPPDAKMPPTPDTALETALVAYEPPARPLRGCEWMARRRKAESAGVAEPSAMSSEFVGADATGVAPAATAPSSAGGGPLAADSTPISPRASTMAPSTKRVCTPKRPPAGIGEGPVETAAESTISSSSSPSSSSSWPSSNCHG